jgi:hypothetical protein
LIITKDVVYFLASTLMRRIFSKMYFRKGTKAKTENSRRGKASSESGMVGADATCPLKIPPELPTEPRAISVFGI